MLDIKKNYIIDENNKKVAVQLDVITYEKIEQVLENYALGELIKANNPEEVMTLDEAKSYYNTLNKAE